MPAKPLRLTARRHAHASARKEAPTFKGLPLRHPAAVEARYVAALGALTARMTEEVKREVVRLFQSPAARAHFATFAHNVADSARTPGGNFRCVVRPLDGMDAAPGPRANMGTQARKLVDDLSARFTSLFSKRAQGMAEQMADGTAAASKTALHGSLSKLTGGLSLKTGLMSPQLRAVYNASVATNVGLIKTIAKDYLSRVEGSVMRSITTGSGLEDLVPELEDIGDYTHRKAKNVALDQTRKTYNSINRGRMTAIGVRQFQWIHSGGGAEPRPEHEAMDGQIYSFDNPPVIDERTGERGIPGQAINCKCTMAPVFTFGENTGNTDDESSN